jgi:hypothetical protein
MWTFSHKSDGGYVDVKGTFVDCQLKQFQRHMTSQCKKLWEKTTVTSELIIIIIIKGI